MKHYLPILAVLLWFLPLLGACQNEANSYVAGVNEARKEKDEMFKKDKEHSPLEKKDRRKFKHLDYYEVNPDYKVVAQFKRTENEKEIDIPTSKNVTKKFVKYGEALFEMDGKVFSLNLYQNVRLRELPEHKNSLFLPFTDLTSGESTYGGGRYLDLKIPDGENITLDFNLAYNPYCAYNGTGKYSCPIPPKANFVKAEIKAGEKNFAEH